jgi:hypothetical protein
LAAQPGTNHHLLSVQFRHVPAKRTTKRPNHTANDATRPCLSCHADGEGKCELGAALYQTNVLGTKGPRKMTVLVPKLAPGGRTPHLTQPKGEGSTLLGQ